MRKSWLVGLVSILLLIAYVLAEDPLVTTKYGPIRGFTTKTLDGKPANIFLGIPFAKPPVGDLRFEKPEKPQKWSEVLEAKEFKPACYPHHRSGARDLNFLSEDCLYLNIMAPVQKAATNYAVIVWIHGGGYNVGDAISYGYQNISENFISRDIVYVTIQYRLGPFGFMSSGDEVMPGNYGLWDQIAALEFIKENIAFFGGDQNRIIIQGQGAGSASTSCLTISPHSRDLFVGSLQMGGSVFSQWGINALVDNESLRVAKELNCQTEDFEIMKKCLKTKSPDDFLDAVEKTGKSRDNVKTLKFTPRLDGYFFPEDLDTLIKDSPKIPSVIGVTENEGILLALYPFTEAICNFQIRPEDFEHYNRKKLVDFIKQKVATKEEFGNKVEEVQNRIIDFYASLTAAEEDNYEYWLTQYSRLLTDVLFVMAVRREVEMKVKDGWPVWLYVIDYYNPSLYEYGFPGTTHADELSYMFVPFTRNSTTFDENDIKFQQTLLDSFSNFAKENDPSTNNFKWEQATVDHPTKNLRLRAQPVMDENFSDENYRFWKSMEVYDYDIISGKARVKITDIKTEL